MGVALRAAALFLPAVISSTAHGATLCTEPAACRTTMAFEGGHVLTFYVSAPLDQPQPDVRRAVVVIHGTGGRADSYFRTMTKAAVLAGEADDTLVVAPRFVEEGHGKAPGKDELFWNRGADWRAGGLSNRDTPPRISSFDIASRILARIADRRLRPNLTTIVIAGHSAGGQFVQRYAIGQPADPALAGLRVVYVAANPSSYLYLDAHRPDPDRPGAFVVPARSDCSTNRFKFGLEKPNAYFKRQSTDEMIARYRAREVVYLLGEADNDPNAKNLSRTCAAVAQGADRLARGKAFMAYMNALFAPHAHRLVTVPHVGHSARAMFQSSQGLALLFD